MEDLSLHILDIAENSIDAGAGRIDITIRDSESEDALVIRIRDNGKGMDEEIMRRIEDPFFTTKTVRNFGLGIPLLVQAVGECNGAFSIDSKKGEGTALVARFQRSHIDRKPMGDLGSTMMVLIGGHPEIDFTLTYERDDSTYTLDTSEIKRGLEGVPINLPEVLQYIRGDVNEGVRGKIDGKA